MLVAGLAAAMIHLSQASLAAKRKAKPKPIKTTESVRKVETVKIGFSLPLTGTLASAGRSAALALEIWKDEINAKGGLLGRPVQFISYDDRSDPSRVAELYGKLVDTDKADLVISSFGTANNAAAMPLVTERKLLFMALFGNGINKTQKYDRYFQIAPFGPDGALAQARAFLDTAITMEPRPRTLALIAGETEQTQAIAAAARQTAGALGLLIVHDKSYSSRTVDFTEIVRGVQAADADVVFVASNPPGTAGILRAVREVGLRPKMLGGAMRGLSLAPVKAQLGELLNGVVAVDFYVPEPTMQFFGIADFLQKYRALAKGVAVDTLGLFIPPFAFAQMQVLEQAVAAVGSLDQAKLAAYIHNASFETIVGNVKFGADGEWERSRLLLVQYRGASQGDAASFAQPGVQVVLHPPELKSGNLAYPYADIAK